MSEELTTIPQENSTIAQQTTVGVPNIWADPKALAQAWKIAEFFSKSKLVPENYQGEQNKGNCLIAIDLAARLNLNPLMVMQTLFIVKGKPAWSGQMAISLVNGCGRFTPLEFVYVGEGIDRACYAQTKRKTDGSVIQGTTISLQMAKDEGWGAKWKTMPEQMLAYRAGSFFARLHCPDVLMGLQTAEEVEDVRGEDIKTKTILTLD